MLTTLHMFFRTAIIALLALLVSPLYAFKAVNSNLCHVEYSAINHLKDSEEGEQVESYSEYYRTGNIKYWKLAVRIGTNYSDPLAGYAYEIGSGYGYEADIRLAMDRHINLKIAVSKSGLSLWRHIGINWQLNHNMKIINESQKITVTRYIIGGEIYQYLIKDQSRPNLFYIGLGMGVINNTLKAEITAQDTSGGLLATGGNKSSTKKFMLNVNFGLIIAINKNMGVDVGISWDVIPFYGKKLSENKYATIFDIKFGLVGFY